MTDQQEDRRQQDDRRKNDDGRPHEIVHKVEQQPAIAGPTMDPGQAATFAKELVKELFDSLKAAEASGEDTRLFFPEGISGIKVHMKVGGGTAPAVDVEFSVNTNQR